jgi:hypothetical protein
VLGQHDFNRRAMTSIRMDAASTDQNATPFRSSGHARQKREVEWARRRENGERDKVKSLTSFRVNDCRRAGRMAKKHAPLEHVNQDKTEAFVNWESNAARITFIVKEIGANNLLRRSKALNLIVGNYIKERVVVDPKHKLAGALNKISGETSKDIQAFHFWLEWTGVMLLTFFVAYLEDGLVILSKKNPSLLRELPSLDAKRLFEVPSLEEWRDEVRKRWAENFLQGKGPEDWCKRLTALGARGYETTDIAAIKHRFDTRNSIIHTHGVASREYITRIYKTLP